MNPVASLRQWPMAWSAKSDFWETDPGGIEQVSCVYTAQGFEFDRVGVVFGPDLVHWTMDRGWVDQCDLSPDRIVRRGVTDQEFTDFVKSAYRVLLIRGCYVYFMDALTRDFLLGRGERPEKQVLRAAEVPVDYR